MAESILSKKTLRNELDNFLIDTATIESCQRVFSRWNNKLQTTWANVKETELTSEFYSQILINILGYHPGPDDEYTIAFETKTRSTSQRPDVVIGHFKDKDLDIEPVALIEFESPYTLLDSRNKGVEQAFRYQSQYKTPVKWIIASNFKEIRLYQGTREHVEIFYMETLARSKDDIKRLLYFLSSRQLLPEGSQKAKLEIAVAENVAEQLAISKSFYSTYLQTRKSLISNILKNNQLDELSAFTAAQKILDRFIFIAFAEDYNLIPRGTFDQTQVIPEQYFSMTPIWDQMKTLFRAIDRGWPAKHINHFNGGLFKYDYQVDELDIEDDVFDDFRKIANYDFESDLSVNLLGHIFEQAITDIDTIKNNSGNGTKRKKDGIFYTPTNITSYLLSKTVGSWIEEQHRELRFDSLPKYDSSSINQYRAFIEKRPALGSTRVQRANENTRNVQRWVEALTELRNRLQHIKIVDPAVGSGSFLNSAFELLKDEMTRVDNELFEITGVSTLFDFDATILENNLFGVDINKESVEIAKLSLWLKTANKEKPLTSLDKNILAGNSIISDRNITKDALDWKNSFSDIFSKNNGFDIVIGNPPYVSSVSMKEEEKRYYDTTYVTSEYQPNLYRIFIEKGFDIIKPDGWLGFIVPNTWLTNQSFSKLRNFLLTNTTHLTIINVKDKVFPDASVDTSLIIFKKHKPVGTSGITFGQMSDGEVHNERITMLSKIKDTAGAIVVSENDAMSNLILDTIKAHMVSLSSVAQIKDGVKVYQKGKGKPAQTGLEKEDNKYISDINFGENWLPFLDKKSVRRYFVATNTDKYINYGPWLAEPRTVDLFRGEKIYLRMIPVKHSAHAILASYSERFIINERFVKVLSHLSLDPLFILGVLNSCVMTFWLDREIGVFKSDTYPQMTIKQVSGLPIPNIGKQRQNQISALVTKQIEIEKKLYKIADDFNTFSLVTNSKWKYAELGKTSLNIPKRIKSMFNGQDRVDVGQMYEKAMNEYRSLQAQSEINVSSLDVEVMKAFGLTGNERKNLRVIIEGIV